MKSRKAVIILVSYSLILAIALIWGSWGVSYAQTSIAPLIPTAVIPVTGGEICKSGTSYTSGVVAELNGVQASALDDKGNPCLTVEAPAGNLGNGEAIKIEVVDMNTAGVNLVNPLTEVFNVGVTPSQQLSNTLTHTFTLSDAELEAFKANPNMGVLWYDAANGVWVKLDAVVQGNQVIVQTDKVGLFTIGTIL